MRSSRTRPCVKCPSATVIGLRIEGRLVKSTPTSRSASGGSAQGPAGASDGGVAREFPRRVQVGMVGINVPIPVPMAQHGFGGWKKWVDLIAVQRLLVRYGVRAESEQRVELQYQQWQPEQRRPEQCVVCRGCAPRRMMPREEEG